MKTETINNNIQESYCSLEVSKKLKEKGFDCGFKSHYNPTHALAIEWIRVNFGIWISLYPYDEFREDYFSFMIVRRSRNYYDKYPYNSPQEATEAALKYTLESLI